MDQRIAWHGFMSLYVGLVFHLIIDAAEILVAGVEQGIEAVDHEIGLLEVVDDVFGAHDTLQVEGDPVGAVILKRKHGLVGA